jgi:hypothetical protein
MVSSQNNDGKIYWGEIPPCEHFVQIYYSDDLFVASLEAFVAEGLEQGECVIVIATKRHLSSLESRLRKRGCNINRSNEHYIALDADEILSNLMIEGLPDETLLEEFVTELIARTKGRRTRAFGEMTAILWLSGNQEATIRLEQLWNRIAQREKFPLFCAYPITLHSEGAGNSLREICAIHTKVILDLTD